MMRALNRLRRSVALFICPELGVQASMDPRVGFFDLDAAKRHLRDHDRAFSVAGPLSGDAMVTVLMRLNGAADPWAEFGLWLQERRSLNQSLGGDDQALITLLMGKVAMLRLPVSPAAQLVGASTRAEELGVGAMTEPRAEGRYLTAEQKHDLENRIFRAADPWREMLSWLSESRATGWRLPKGGDAFVGQMVLLASSMSVPAGDAHAARQPHSERSVFVFDPELRAVVRHRRVERAKKVLKVIQLAEQGRVTEEPDLLFDRAAEELAVLLFGEA